jgi:hypothetical protein
MVGALLYMQILPKKNQTLAPEPDIVIFDPISL